MSSGIFINLRTIFTVIVAVLQFSAYSANSATPEEYHRRIDSAVGHVGQLISNGSEVRNRNNEADLIAAIQKEIAAIEVIDTPGGTVETSNQWLLEGLEQFRSETDAVKRAAILTGLDERLRSISDKLTELQNAEQAETTKDADKQRLAEILRREEYQKPLPKSESLFQKWWREFWEWVDRVFPSPSLSPASGIGLGALRNGLQLLIFGLVIAIAVFVLYKLAPFLSRRFGRNAGAADGDRVILGERVRSGESAGDLFGEAERLAHEGDLRGAIRKGYIALLCELSDRKLIALAHHKTNRDYLRDVRKQAPIFENMRGMTSGFERNWYGLKHAEPADWEDFRALYLQTVASARPGNS